MRASALRGSAWTLGWRWSVRLIGIGNTIVLARLLTPTDFGIYAMSMLVIGIIGIFGESGQSLALIRLGKPSREHLDTAWTVQLIVYLSLAAVVVVAAPLAGIYFHSHTVQIVVYFMSLRFVAQAFTNIGIVAFRIELDYARSFRFGVYQKLITVAVTIAFAVALRNYWALAIALVTTKIAEVLLSYGMHPYRPRFCLSKFGEIWSFSFWMLVVYVSQYFARKVDQFIVGAVSPPADMGRYNVGSEVATMPTIDLVEPINYALFPLYSRLLGDSERLRGAVILSLGAAATVCLATGPGIASIAREFTLVVLGHRWEEAAPLVFWLALGGIPIGLNYCIYSVLSVTGKARLTAVTIWIRMVLLVPTLLVAARWGGIEAVAAAQPAIGCVVLVVDFYMLQRAVDIRTMDIVSCLYRPATAAIAMVTGLWLFEQLMMLPVFPQMLLKIALGGTIYTSTLYALWWLARRPDGVEAMAVNFLGRIFESRFGYQRG